MAQPRNLDYIRNVNPKEAPELGPKLFEALSDLQSQLNVLGSQVNGTGYGQAQPPPSVSGLQVSAQNGHFSVAINDENPVYRGVEYTIEHADNPSFTNPQIIHLGPTRNWTGFLGNVTRYWRAYSSYPTAEPSPAVYHGGVTPKPVNGGGSNQGPNFLPSQSSGTGSPGQGLTGFGPIPFRSLNGVPPIR